MPLVCGSGRPSFCWSVTGWGFEAAIVLSAERIWAWSTASVAPVVAGEDVVDVELEVEGVALA